MLFWVIINLVFSLLYLLLIRLLIIGWNKLKENSNPEPDCKGIKLSVIVALRNEEKNVEHLIRSFLNLDIEALDVEFILVDDKSSDNTIKLLHAKTSEYPIFRIYSNINRSGKKNAILLGIKNSTGNLIITTDADCVHPKEWLKEILNYYCRYKPKMILGPVLMKHHSYFGKIQALDFFSLMISGAAAAGLKKPIMCNGANLAYEKTLLEEFKNPLKIETLSGDDIFLLLAVKEKYPGQIHFLKSKQAVVYTKPEKSLFSFLSQRKRWASKSKYYKDKQVIAVALIVLITNLLLICNFLAGLFDLRFYLILFSVLIVKGINDYYFLRISALFFQQSLLLKAFFPALFFNFIYIPIAAISGLVSIPKWKDRRTKA
ncbi:MAG: glycosyltransferase [Bacteroidales bacterium]